MLPYSLNSAKTDDEQFLSHGFPHFSNFIFLAGATRGNFCAEHTLTILTLYDVMDLVVTALSRYPICRLDLLVVLLLRPYF